MNRNTNVNQTSCPGLNRRRGANNRRFSDARGSYTNASFALKDDDDVLSKDEILGDGISCMPIMKDRSFYLDYSAYMAIVDSSYRSMTHTLCENVSLSQYLYYCQILLWKRLMYVLTERGDGVIEYETLKGMLWDMFIPEEVGVYLDGIGNILDWRNLKYDLKLQAEPRSTPIMNIPGHFGRVGAATHQLYETIPSPFVAVLRMLYDLAITDGLAQRPAVDIEPIWNLPDELRPEQAALRINRNLLGWAPAKSLTHGQVQMCHSAGISASVAQDGAIAFDTAGISSIRGLPIIRPLLLAISDLLASVKFGQLAFKGHAEATSTQGTLAICGFNQCDSDRSRDTGPALVPIYERNATPYTTWKISSVYILSGVALFRYRVKRVEHGFYDSLCYTGPQGEGPSGWIDNADDIFQSVPEWNFHEFTGPLFSGQLIYDEYIARVRRHQ